MAVSIADVKELRERTSAGIADCKKALEACEGNMEKAIDWLREKGIAKAAGKASRIAAEGLASVIVNGNEAVLVEINSETDFSAKTDKFKDMVKLVATTILEKKPATVEEALELTAGSDKLSEVIAAVSFATGEKMTLRRFEVIEKTDDQVFGQYVHFDGKTGVVVVLNGDKADVAKGVAMQLASMKAEYLTREDIPQEKIDHETELQTKIANEDPSFSKKPEKIQQSIINGRVSKTFQESCLVDQSYILDGTLTVGKFLAQNNMTAVKFVRFVVGEGIEKRVDNWVEEVMAAAKGN